MARRTWAQLATLYADNTTGNITAERLRDGFDSIEPYVASRAPDSADDQSVGFDIGHGWINVNTTPRTWYVCVDASPGAAVWAKVYPADALTEVAWGSITGDLGDQTDLDTALAGKAATGHTHTLSEVTDSGTAAAAATTDFATAAQGALADTAVQPGDPVDINAQTGTTYTLVLADAGKLVTLSNAGAITLTVPTNEDAAFPVGTVIALQQLGAGAISVEGDTGVTINGTDPGSESLTDAQYITTAALTKHATDTWTLTGAVEQGS